LYDSPEGGREASRHEEEAETHSRINAGGRKRYNMNWDRVEGQWKQRRGKAVRHWGKMMNDELAAIAGKYEELVGRLQERYGIATEEARGQVARYKDTVDQLKKSHVRLVDLQKIMIRKEKTERAKREKLRAKKKAR
jgi:uncharacterized protein YjbJ (UPF0337 family)